MTTEETKPQGPIRSKDATGKGTMIIKNLDGQMRHSTREPLGLDGRPRRKGRDIYEIPGATVISDIEATYENGSWYY